MSSGDYEVLTVQELGWETMNNGLLLRSMVDHHFDFFLTSDRNLQVQQNLSLFDVAVVIFDVSRNKIELIAPLIPKFLQRMNSYSRRMAYVISE